MTEHKRFEQLLENAARHWRNIFDSIPSFVSVHDKDFKFMSVNKKLADFVKAKPKELIGRQCYEIFHGTKKPLPDCPHTKMLKSKETVTLEIDEPHIGCPLQVTVSPIFSDNGKLIAGVHIAEDISVRKQVETLLYNSEKRYRNLFENSPISLWEEDFSEFKKYIDNLKSSGVKDFRKYFKNHPEDVVKCTAMVKVTDVNNTTLKFYKIGNKKEFQEGIGRFFTEESYDVFREELVALAGGKTSFGSEAITQSLSGKRNYIHIRLSVIPGYEETLSKVLVSIVDITELKRAEEALQKAHDELEMRVKERTSELAKATKHCGEAEKNLRIRARELQESNVALKVLLKQRENDKKECEENILSNVKHLILPYIEKLKKNISISEELTYLNILESNLKEIISPFSLKLSSKYLSLSPKEIQIADLIKDGKQDKDIVEILNISSATVKTHRQNIRKKLGIYSKKTNLRTYLLSL